MDCEREERSSIPLFCVETTEKRTGQTLYINFKASDVVEGPEPDINEDELVREICSPRPKLERFTVPLRISRIFWRNTEYDIDRRDYVIDVDLNDKFAWKAIPSDVLRHFVATVALSAIEEKFNGPGANELSRQYIGHKLELDQTGFKILEHVQLMARSEEVVNNKILLVERPSTSDVQKEKVPTVSKANLDDLTESSYDLHLRPSSRLLTCSIPTDTCPDSISFNDDRICVKLGEKNLIDVYLPVKIDLNKPAKYKFDDRTCLFRIVFELEEV